MVWNLMIILKKELKQCSNLSNNSMKCSKKNKPESKNPKS